jgi:hypothetical protein
MLTLLLFFDGFFALGMEWITWYSDGGGFL